MSGAKLDPYLCWVCGQKSREEINGVRLCNEHAAVARRLEKLEAAQTDDGIDLRGRLSNGPRDSHKGGYKRPFDVVPEDSLENVSRDVTVNVDHIPMWAAQELFRRIHTELGKPDIDEWHASITIKYSGLDEGQYERLHSLDDELWVGLNIHTTETRIFKPLSERRTLQQEAAE